MQRSDNIRMEVGRARTPNCGRDGVLGRAFFAPLLRGPARVFHLSLNEAFSRRAL